MPEIFDMFEENGNTYLTMEFIQGTSLDDEIRTNIRIIVGFNDHQTHLSLISYFLQITKVIGKLHKGGYILGILPRKFYHN